MNPEMARFMADRFRFAGNRCENECCPNDGKVNVLRIFWPHHKKWPRTPRAEHFHTTEVLCASCYALAEWAKWGKYPLRQTPMRMDPMPVRMEQVEMDFGEAA